MASTAESPAPTLQATQQAKFGHSFFATIGSSPAAIVFSCLVALGTLTVLVGLLGWAIRSCCLQRRRKKMDDDTWRFLEAPDDFQCHFVDLKTQPSVQSFIDDQSRAGFIVEQDLGALAPPAPIPSRYNEALLSSTIAKVDHAIVSMESSEFSRDSDASTLRNLPPALGSNYTRHSSVGLPAYKSDQEDMQTYENQSRRLALVRNLNNRATMYVSSAQAPTPRSIRPASLFIPLARDSSLACSEQSTTIEDLRENLSGRGDPRATLRGAILREREADEEFLESLKVLWHQKNLDPSNRFTNNINLQTPEIPPPQDQPLGYFPLSPSQLSSTMRITKTEDSCYSVESTGH